MGVPALPAPRRRRTRGPVGRAGRRAEPARDRAPRRRGPRPTDGPRPASAGARIAGALDRRLAGRLRRANDRDDPDRPGGRRAHPLRPGHPLLTTPDHRRDAGGPGAFDLNNPAPSPSTDLPTGGPIGDGRSALADFRPDDLDPLCAARPRPGRPGPRDLPAGRRHRDGLRRHPGPAGVAVNTRSIDRLIDYPFADMTITVQAGMTLSALKAILAEQRQRLLVNAPHPDRATLGGIYATNTTGSRRFGAGRPRDQIIGVSFVTSDGAVVKGGGRVVKNVAGYDFPKLLTGSMGTLGIIVQLTRQGPADPGSLGHRLDPADRPDRRRRTARPAQYVRHPADRPGPAQCPGRPRHRPGAWPVRRVPGAGRRLRG